MAARLLPAILQAERLEGETIPTLRPIMNKNVKIEPVPLLAPKKLAAVNSAMQAWLERQAASGEFDSTWAGAAARFGGGLVNVDSSDEVEIVIFG